MLVHAIKQLNGDNIEDDSNINCKDKFTLKDGFNFKFNSQACTCCGGRCCCGEIGYIWLNDAEIKAIAEHLNIELDIFISDYLRRENGKYTIKDIKYQGYYSCLFFDRDVRHCSIYPVRPAQCRTFPFWETYKKDPKPLFTDCPGVEEIVIT